MASRPWRTLQRAAHRVRAAAPSPLVPDDAVGSGTLLSSDDLSVPIPFMVMPVRGGVWFTVRAWLRQTLDSPLSC